MKIAFHWVVIIGLFAGVLIGILLRNIPGGSAFATNWIKPIGNIFLNLLKLLAIPLIVTSLVKGITDLKDISSLSRMGGKTFGWYLITTVIAVTLGLAIVNIIKPGTFVSPETRSMLLTKFSPAVAAGAKPETNTSFMHHLETLVPENIFSAVTSNSNMLQVIVFTLLFGISLLMVPQDKTKVIRDFFENANAVVMQMIKLVMKITP